MRRLLIPLALLLFSASAAADYKQYAKGVEAAEKSEWAKVDQLIGAAYADDAAAKERARLYGQYFRPYIPQYYLALSASKRNDCTSALKYLNDAGYKALIGTGGKAAAEASQDAAIRSRCAATTIPPPPPPPPPPLATLSERDRADATRALAQLEQGLIAARNAKVAAAPLAAATTRAEQARAAAQAAVSKADAAQLKQALAQVTTATSELGTLTEAAKRLASTTVTPPPPPPAARLEPAAGLRTALTAYLNGDYSAVLAVAIAGMDTTSAAHTALLRAASRYSLYVLGGESDPGLKTQAETEVREARRNLASIRANPKFFSPRFVEFFDRTR